jgi:hypothetical protein
VVSAAFAETPHQGNEARLLRVGARHPLKSVTGAAALARDGDTIEIDAGEYVADVAVWTQDRLTIRAVGGQARFVADGASAEGKAIWVIRGGAVAIENIAFSGARVPGRNGAGIRLERGRLTVRNCIFTDNENGILTANTPDIELTVEESEFGHNGHGDGKSHNLYAGRIGRLSVTGSYFHHARVGHLLKSRAADNRILYNRFTDEPGGRASYELEFPSGGTALVIGNIIAQGPTTENPVLVSFGAEGYAWPVNALYLINNTLVDGRAVDGRYLAVASGGRSVFALNNLLLGNGRLESAGPGEYVNNPNAVAKDFVDAARQDYRLLPGNRFRVAEVQPRPVSGVELAPRREYMHPRRTRVLEGRALSPGALQSGAPAP